MREDRLSERLDARCVLVLDGGLATELERRGAVLDDALWSARLLEDNPGLILEVHRTYVEAGADVLITASYQATPQGFLAANVDEDRAHALLRRSVELARKAAALRPDEPPLVAASVGTYGAFLGGGREYQGRFGLTPEAYQAFHRPRLKALLSAEPDVLALETFPSLDEAEALAALLEKSFPDARAWLSVTTADGVTTRGGDPLEAVAALAERSPSLVAVGVNCCPPETVSAALARMRTATRKPLVAYPNSGEGWDPLRKAWTPPAERHDLTTLARRWVEQGARLVGGCCRTGPEDIRRVRAAL